MNYSVGPRNVGSQLVVGSMDPHSGARAGLVPRKDWEMLGSEMRSRLDGCPFPEQGLNFSAFGNTGGEV